MEFYHQKEIEQLKPKCPSETCLPIERECYRWVFDSIEDIRNFQSQAIKNPVALNNKNDIQKCSFYALSFFMSIESCRVRFEEFSSRSPNAYKRLGTKIAKGLLNREDGVADKVSSSGHFNFHHAKNANLSSKFAIIEGL